VRRGPVAPVAGAASRTACPLPLSNRFQPSLRFSDPVSLGSSMQLTHDPPHSYTTLRSLRDIAAAMGAEKLILLTDTVGILKDQNDLNSLIRHIKLSEVRELIDQGVVNGGMTPKAQCCIRALAQGVGAAHIIDGRIPHSLLLEIFTDKGIGTMITSRG